MWFISGNRYKDRNSSNDGEFLRVLHQGFVPDVLGVKYTFILFWENNDLTKRCVGVALYQSTDNSNALF